MHMQVCLGTKFQLRLTILMFWEKFAQTRYFQSKTQYFHFSVWSFLTILNFFAREPTNATEFVTRQDKGA